MVRDRQLASTDYLALLRETLPLEGDMELCEAALGNAALCFARYVPEDRREAEASALCEVALRPLSGAAGADMRLMWTRALVNIAFSPEDLDLAARLADGRLDVEGLSVDQDMRWTIAVKHVARGMPGAEGRLAEERRRDPSDRGQRAALRAEAARPEPAIKAAAWERFHGDGYGSLHLTGAAMSGFSWSFQGALLEPYVEGFFERVRGVFEARTHEYASTYFTHLFPAYCVEPAVLARSTALLSVAPAHPMLDRMLREANDELARAIACRDLATHAAPLAATPAART
jgi:aminopeptidase N